MINFITDLDLDTQMMLALGLPFLLTLLIGPLVIFLLRALKAGQPIREARQGVLAPEHQSKAGTPTMGGLMLIGLVLLASLLFLDLSSERVQCVLFVTIITAILGFLDDYAKIRRHNSAGVSGWFKIGLQAIAATGCAVYLYLSDPNIDQVTIPFYDTISIGWLFIPLAILTIIATSNAVNLTDGLDGLASGCMIPTCLFFLYVILWQPAAEEMAFATEEMAPFITAIISACIGFLWFNCHPAKVFMGDTGSLALGGALGTLAVCSGTEFMLIFAGGVFVAEASSVVIQVLWFKYTRWRYGEGRRFFRMAPLHHHFEKIGWSETQVCMRFWIINLIFLALSIYIYELSYS